MLLIFLTGWLLKAIKIGKILHWVYFLHYYKYIVAFVQILVKGQGHDVIYVYKFISTFVKKLVNETVELCEYRYNVSAISVVFWFMIYYSISLAIDWICYYNSIENIWSL